MDPVVIGDLSFEPRRAPLLIAGPCVLESEEDALRIAGRCAELARRHGFMYVFKASYLKDNRSSVGSYTGPGLEAGLRILGRVRSEAGVPVLTDVHCRQEVAAVAAVADVLQIPAFLARQTRLIMAAAAAGKPLNLKKGQFLSPRQMCLAVEKARAGGARGVLVTERGTMFGYHDLVVDMTAFSVLREARAPVIFDATHSLQLPGGLGDRSGGRPQFVTALARAAMAAGADGLFVETHPDPSACRCDADVMLPLGQLEPLLRDAARIFKIVREDVQD